VLAIPVLDLSKIKSITKDIEIIKVFIEPKSIRNSSRFNFPVISDPIMAAWLLPKPGKRVQIGETMAVARRGFLKTFFGIVIFPIICFGMRLFCFIE